MKEEEAQRLQVELHSARIQMEQNQKTLHEVMNARRHADEDDMNSEQSTSRSFHCDLWSLLISAHMCMWAYACACTYSFCLTA